MSSYLDVRCPYCGAAPGSECVTDQTDALPLGTPMPGWPHPIRLEALRRGRTS